MASGTRIVIIGGVAAGPKTAARARRRDFEAQITIIEQGEYVSYASCGIPYYIGGQTPDFQDLIGSPIGNRDPEFFDDVKDVQVRIRTRAEYIDRQRKEVHVVDLQSGTTETIPYDKLVLTTGSTPIRLNIPGSDLDGIHPVWTLNDAVAIRKELTERRATRVAIVGAGLIGLELAESLLEVGKDKREKPAVRIIEMQDQIVPAALDPEMAALVMKQLRGKSLEISTGQMASAFESEGDNGRVSHVITGKNRFPADLVAAAIGARPNTTLAREAGLEIGPTGAIAVNEFLQTSDPDIYAGGDCAQNWHLISEQPVFTPMGSVANRHGRVIGNNLTGSRETFPGVLGTSIFKVFDFTVGRTGLTERQAREAGFEVSTVIVSGSDHAHFFPGSKSLVVKLMAERNTGRILGAQLVGTGEVNKRLDVLVAALHMKATVADLANFDLAYAPPYNTAMDVLHHAANTMRNKLAGEAETLTPEAVLENQENEDYLLLDVRTPGEVRRNPGPFPNVVHIPLNQLREEANRLPRDKTVVTYCQISMRAWDAQRILNGKGFKKVRFLEGGLVGWPY